MRQGVVVSVHRADDIYDLDERLMDFIKDLSGYLDQVPEEYREGVRICIQTGYESTAIELEVTYARPETDEEMRSRETAEDLRRQREREWTERNERAVYKHLRAKFGG